MIWQSHSQMFQLHKTPEIFKSILSIMRMRHHGCLSHVMVEDTKPERSQQTCLHHSDKKHNEDVYLNVVSLHSVFFSFIMYITPFPRWNIQYMWCFIPDIRRSDSERKTLKDGNGTVFTLASFRFCNKTQKFLQSLKLLLQMNTQGVSDRRCSRR